MTASIDEARVSEAVEELRALALRIDVGGVMVTLAVTPLYPSPDREAATREAVPYANLHPEEFEWVNLDTDERRPATQSVDLTSRWRLRAMAKP